MKGNNVTRLHVPRQELVMLPLGLDVGQCLKARVLGVRAGAGPAKRRLEPAAPTM